MGKKISEIYAEYKIIPSLQKHMLRVAAVAYTICDNLEVPAERESIITACLLHDMGNIIKFRMDIIPEFFEPEGVNYWQGVKDEYITKYGGDEHHATLEIMKEIGVSDEIIRLVDKINFTLLCAHRDTDDLNLKIVHYSDGRVNPYGVVSFEGRMSEAKKRYDVADSVHNIQEEKRLRLVACGLEIEKQIFEKCKIRPEDINDEATKDLILELKEFVVK